MLEELMRRTMCACVVVCLVAANAHAQADSSSRPRAMAFDTVVAVQDMFFESNNWRTQIIADSMTNAELATGLQVNFRPVLWKVNGRWETLVDQASIRYERKVGLDLRVEAGRFPSPIGLGMMENRASVNAGVNWCHRLYYSPLPSLGPGVSQHSLIAAVYPAGALVSASSSQWDARVALVDRAPVDFWSPSTPFRQRLNTIVGAGVSPRRGARVGVATAWGEMPAASGVNAPGHYRMLNVEGEWAFGYSKLSAEWTGDVFDTVSGNRIATGLTAQWRQMLTPHWFAHSRATLGHAPLVDATGAGMPQRHRSVDSTVGYLVNPDVTLRVGHTVVRGWSRPSLDHQLGVSIVFARRWW
jgi:hypothetical protein